MKLTAKQEKFCQEIALNNKTQTEAYKEAYETVKMKDKQVWEEASKLASSPKVSAKIQELKEEANQRLIKEKSIIISNELLELLIEKHGELESIREIIEDKLSELLDPAKQREFKRSRAINRNTRYSVLENAGFKCQACGEKPTRDNDVVLHIDHIVPYSLGGSNKKENLQVLCHKCNNSKSNLFEVNHND